MNKMINNKTILVTGGTGSFGSIFIEYLLKNFNPKLCNNNCGNMIANKHFGVIGKKGDRTNLKERYRVPFKLIRSLFDTMENENFYI